MKLVNKLVNKLVYEVTKYGHPTIRFQGLGFLRVYGFGRRFRMKDLC
jgi:hypothetical protein